MGIFNHGSWLVMDRGYYTRLGAALFTAALMIAVILEPQAGERIVAQAGDRAARIAAAADGEPMATRPCAIGDPAFAGPFANPDDVLSVSPLGGVTAPEEILPAPYIRINTRRGDTAFDRRKTDVLAPVKSDIVAIERKIERGPDGTAKSQSWSLHFRSCEKIAFTYDRLDALPETLITRAGGLAAFTEIGGPDHIAIETKLRVQTGDVVGIADGFDVALHDYSASPSPAARPERYSANSFARAAVLDVPPTLLEAITRNPGRARCALDYLPGDLKADWTDKLGDSWGLRRAKGENACRVALLDTPGALQGAWYTDAAHNGATTKISAIALGPDTIDPDRLIMALHGRLKSLTPDLVGLPPMMEDEREDAARGFLSMTRGDGRINAAFDTAQSDEMYCYERMRANFVGPVINGVILMQRQSREGEPDLLTMEARNDAVSCIDLEEPWVFSADATSFHR